MQRIDFSNPENKLDYFVLLHETRDVAGAIIIIETQLAGGLLTTFHSWTWMRSLPFCAEENFIERGEIGFLL